MWSTRSLVEKTTRTGLELELLLGLLRKITKQERTGWWWSSEHPENVFERGHLTMYDLEDLQRVTRPLEFKKEEREGRPPWEEPGTSWISTFHRLEVGGEQPPARDRTITTADWRGGGKPRTPSAATDSAAQARPSSQQALRASRGRGMRR